VTFVSYYNAIDNQFIWDDEFLILKDSTIKDWGNLASIFTKGVIDDSALNSVGAYRPLQTLSFMADYSIWRYCAEGYHFTSLMCHIFTVISLYFLIVNLFGDRILAGLASLVYSLHPLHVEAVGYISGRSDIISAFFVINAFNSYLLYEKKGKIVHAFMTVILFAMALFSRENSIIFPVIILSYNYIFKKHVKKYLLMGLTVIAIMYMEFRFILLKKILLSAMPQNDLLLRIPSVFEAFLNYIMLLIFPCKLHMEYGYKYYQFYDFKVIAGMMVFVFLLYYIIKGKNNIVRYGLIFFILTFIPISNVIKLNAYMAEHWMYTPAIGFCIIFGYFVNLCILNKNRYIKEIGCMILLIAVIYYGSTSYNQNILWGDPEKLYKNILKYNKFSVRALLNISTFYVESGRYSEAEIACLDALKINRNCVIAYINLGVVYEARNEYREAEDMLLRAINLEPANTIAYNNLGILYLKKGNNEEGKKCFFKAVEINPDEPKTYYNLSIFYYDLKDYKLALKYIKMAEEKGGYIDKMTIKRLEDLVKN